MCAASATCRRRLHQKRLRLRQQLQRQQHVHDDPRSQARRIHLALSWPVTLAFINGPSVAQAVVSASWRMQAGSVACAAYSCGCAVAGSRWTRLRTRSCTRSRRALMATSQARCLKSVSFTVVCCGCAFLPCLVHCALCAARPARSRRHSRPCTLARVRRHTRRLSHAAAGTDGVANALKLTAPLVNMYRMTGDWHGYDCRAPRDLPGRCLLGRSARNAPRAMYDATCSMHRTPCPTYFALAMQRAQTGLGCGFSWDGADGNPGWPNHFELAGEDLCLLRLALWESSTCGPFLSVTLCRSNALDGSAHERCSAR